MTGKVRAAVAVARRRMELQAFARPEIGDEDGLLRVEMCGVCGSDPRIFDWADASRFPLIMGHELVGHVAEIGRRAAARWGVEVGDRVIVEHLFGCGHCRWCLVGEYRFCREGQGYGGPTPSSVPPHLWGAYSEYMYLAPNARVHKISADVPAEAAAMTCANIGNGLRWVQTVGGVKSGDTVVVLGPGGQGLAAVLAAKEAGAGRIVAAGLSRDGHRLALARAFGATDTVNLEEDDAVEAVGALTDGALADLVVDVTGATASLGLALELARPLGTVVVGSNTGEEEARIVASRMPVKELRVLGVNSHDTPAVRAAIQVVESRRYPIEKMVTHSFSLEEAETAVMAAGGEVELEGFVKGVIVPGRF